MWVLLVRKKETLTPFLVALAPFIIVQLLYPDVVRKIYFISLLNLLLVYIFCQAVYTFFKVCKEPEKIFRQILGINFIFCLIAIIFYFTPWYELLWYEKDLTAGVNVFRRMSLLTYEPSYYATLFAPIFCFFFLQYLFRQNKIRGWKLLPMLFLPYLLSLSFGVIGALLIAGILVYLIYFVRLTSKRRVFHCAMVTGSFSLIAISMFYFFFGNVPLVLRFVNIFSGNDLSGRARTVDSFIIAKNLLGEDHKWFGIGFGQIKLKGASFIQEYYMYVKDFVPTIPNAMAETWTVFGWTGMLVRLFIEIFLFFHTKVWNNYYRLWLFFFIFIYQFTGSFITNIAEYVIWIVAFTNVFPQFAVKRNTNSSAESTG